MKTKITNYPYTLAMQSINPKAGMTAQEQLISRPKIDDVVCHYLDGETLKKALHFIDNVYSDGMKIKWNNVNVWSVHYKFKHICDIAIERGVLKVHQISNNADARNTQFVYDAESMKRVTSVLRSVLFGNQEVYQASH